jgi:hypothetical protein
MRPYGGSSERLAAADPAIVAGANHLGALRQPRRKLALADAGNGGSQYPGTTQILGKKILRDTRRVLLNAIAY